MIYALVILIVISVVLYLRYSNRVTRQKKVAGIREVWGKPKTTSFYFPSIRRYAEIANQPQFHELSGQTISDIDLESIFEFVDRTVTRPGQQILFRKMIHPLQSVGTLQKLNSDALLFAGDSPLREEIQVDMSPLGNSDAYQICSLLQNKLIDRPAWFNLLFINVGIMMVMLLLAIPYPVFLLLLLIPASINMFIHYWNRMNTFQFGRSLTQLNQLISVVNGIRKKDPRPENKEVQKSIEALTGFGKKMKMINLGQGSGLKDELGQVATYFIEWLKACFLVEVISFFLLIRELENKKNSIQSLFDYIGELDVAISVASLRAGEYVTCQPVFEHPGATLSAVNIYHPLIENCAKNNLDIRSKSILITGSNMSGKTTFLRTVMINSILAQTLYTCFADSFTTPVLKQFSSIRIDDNLMEGKSYYLAEVELMKSLIGEADSNDQSLFVLDEVFKGTNTIERIAAAKSILSYLHRNNNLVIVSTHDVELSAMLQDEYELFHFTETIQDDQLFFDHKMKSGPLRTRNAIKILDMSGFPKVIIDEANSLTIALEQGTKS